MQWRNIEECLDKNIGRNLIDITELLKKEKTETRELYLRACYNSKIAPYNFQGFFLNFGDMLAKNDQPKLAFQAYQAAKKQKDYQTWPHKSVLEDKIINISKKKPSLMIESAHSCMACHQK